MIAWNKSFNTWKGKWIDFGIYASGSVSSFIVEYQLSLSILFLFLYGTETMICQLKRKGSWVGCLGWQRGRVRTFFLFNPFPLFQIKVEPLNSYFSIIQRKKGTFRNQWQSLYSSLRGLTYGQNKIRAQRHKHWSLLQLLRLNIFSWIHKPKCFCTKNRSSHLQLWQTNNLWVNPLASDWRDAKPRRKNQRNRHPQPPQHRPAFGWCRFWHSVDDQVLYWKPEQSLLPWRVQISW